MADKLTHFDSQGRAQMVDVSDKETTARSATAEGSVTMSPDAMARVRERTGKGEVIAVAELAGIMGAKRTSDLIPLCHPLPISSVKVAIEELPDGNGLHVTATVKTTGQTGVEMEALTAVSVSCLTIYDMVKAVDKTMRIGDVRLREKSGGRSGHFKADDN